ncbi:MAG: hypothetical protein J6V25_01035 [Oscillospiraceae bacterium]|nr:hypothetical protein [Oscillospiraceae bacterium]
MKTISLLLALFVLTAAMLTGCGCTGPNMEQTTPPTVLPTNEEVTQTTGNTTAPTTDPATAPSDTAVIPSESADRGNGGLDGTTATDPSQTEGTHSRSGGILNGTDRMG